MTERFPTSVDPNKIFGLQPKKPKPDPKHGFRMFWFVWVPLGFILGVVVSVISGRDMWLPVWGVSTIGMWVFSREEG